MTLSQILYYLNTVVSVLCNVAVLFYVVPAYQRSKNRAFLLLGASALISLFSIIFHGTIASKMSPDAHRIYGVLVQLMYTAASGCYMTAVVLLCRPILAQLSPVTYDEDKTSPPANPPS